MKTLFLVYAILFGGFTLVCVRYDNYYLNRGRVSAHNKLVGFWTVALVIFVAILSQIGS